MKEKTALVVTSIASPNSVLRELANGCRERDYHFIVIGDEASPADFHIDGCDFYSIERQLETGFELAGICPTRHYARKNIGYLAAIAAGASVIIETDDDNIPLETFWQERKRIQSVKTLRKKAWINVYKYFTDANIWPRGFSLSAITTPVPEYELLDLQDADCPIQQALADDNPDVDAIYRLILPISLKFRKDRRLALTDGALCPFNSQNTTWFPDAFGLMYLPAYSSFRMTDIWRSFIAQRIAWTNDWSILFHGSTVRQERNEHDLMKDFEDEIPGYLHNDRLCRAINDLDLASGIVNINDNLLECYKSLVEMSLLDPKELDLVQAWHNDLARIQKQAD